MVTCWFFFSFFALGRDVEFPFDEKGQWGLACPCSVLWPLYHLFPVVEIPVALASGLASPTPATLGSAHTHTLDRPGQGGSLPDKAEDVVTSQGSGGVGLFHLQNHALSFAFTC